MNIRWLMVLGICLSGISALGLPLAVGDAVPPVSATDQHGMDFVFTNGTRIQKIAYWNPDAEPVVEYLE